KEEKEKPEEKQEPVKKESPAQAPAASAKEPVSAGDEGRLKASPLARKMAEEKGIDIRSIQGSGDHGRIIKRDIENYSGASRVSAAGSAVAGQESYREENVSQMRKTISRRLSESKFSAPHFYLTMEIDMEQAMKAREAINKASGGKVSYNDIIIR